MKKRSGDEEYKLVYSTDPIKEKICKNCLRTESQCKCSAIVNLSNDKIKPAYNIERKGRGGKTVTLVRKLPPNERFLKDLLKHLKTKIGTGGTQYKKNNEGYIEIQGEHLDKIQEIITKYLTKA